MTDNVITADKYSRSIRLHVKTKKKQLQERCAVISVFRDAYS